MPLDADLTAKPTPRPVLVRLASPRGFCAGVERAIRTVEDALATFGAPVFVRRQIVHNSHVVRRLEAMGAVFVDELDQAPADRPVIFSAHGAPQSAYDEATSRHLLIIDATCPLVHKVHNEVRRHVAQRRHVVLVGHRGHPEVVGTLGQCSPQQISLVETLDDAARLAPPSGPLAYATQTTLSMDDAKDIIELLKRRFPHIIAPAKSDICYATQNRQEAVKKIAAGADLILVVGSSQSSNSRRLVDAALAGGALHSILVEDPEEFDLSVADADGVIGISAGASTPEHLVERLLERLAGRRPIKIDHIEHTRETVAFKQPLLLAS